VVAWPPEWQQRIIDALTRAGADRACPRCGHEDFSLLDGYVSLPLQATLSGGPADSIQSVATACDRCGYLALHALNALLRDERDR
jgi:ribosomal protein S27AE